MDSTKIKAVIVAVLATFAALYLGITAATAQFETVAWVVGGVGFAICILLGKKIWLMGIFLTSLSIKLNIPGTPDTALIGQLLVIGFGMMLFLTRRLPYQIRVTELEIWVFIVMLCILQSYLRNPVGLAFFKSNIVGGRPYLYLLIALVYASILMCIKVPPQELKWALHLSLIGAFLSIGIGIFGKFVPQVGVWFGAVEVGSEGQNPGDIDPEKATRIHFLSPFSSALARWVSSYISPLRAAFHPLWAPVVLISLAAAALSGYRSVVANVGLIYLCGLYYRGGFKAQFAAGLIGALFLGCIVLINAMMPLPPNIQRSLSFLPGNWSEDLVRDGQNSTDWRVEMWKQALLTDRYIHNKLLGDGLGFRIEDLERSKALSENTAMNVGGFDANRDAMMLGGSYHSAVVHTVRIMGYIGLAIFFVALFRLAVHAHRQIRRTRRTEWYPVTLFFCIPIVLQPFLFIFNSVVFSAPLFFVSIAIVRLLENNLPLPAYATRKREPYVLAHQRNHAAIETLPQRS